MTIVATLERLTCDGGWAMLVLRKTYVLFGVTVWQTVLRVD